MGDASLLLHLGLRRVRLAQSDGGRAGTALRESAVRATIALPGLFTPAERGDQLLVDGGLLDNLPAGVIRQMGAEMVIAVDVATNQGAVLFFAQRLYQAPLVPDRLINLVELLARSLEVMMREISRRNLEEVPPDLLIRPSIPAGITVLTGFNQTAEIIAAGREAAQQALPTLRRLLDPNP